VHIHPPCDNHPPLAMAPGEAFLGRVYRALASNPATWARTLFISTYDEHGGFFDHVPPLRVGYRGPAGVAFDTTGPRIPAILAGPCAPRRGVCKLPLDNTSILQLLAERFGHRGEGYSAEVTARAQQGIASVSAALDANAGNTSVCHLRPATPVASATAVNDNDLRRAFANAIASLVTQHGVAALAKFPELRGHPGG
jgi:phospholipase C